LLFDLDALQAKPEAGRSVSSLLWSVPRVISWRVVLLSALALAMGLLVYLYLPWRAAADPIINWGDPDNWEGFKWMVTGQGYRRFFFALPREELVTRLREWWNITGAQFPIPTWALAALGLWELARRRRWLALGWVVHAAISLVYSVFYKTTDAYVYLLPVYFYAALCMGQGTIALLTAANQARGPERRQRALADVVTAGLLLLPLISLVDEWNTMDLSHERKAEEYAQEALEVVEPGALILVGSDAHTFALWYYRYVEGLRPDVAVVNEAMMGFEWYRHTVAVHHPEVDQPGPTAERVTKLDLALRNLDERAVYIAEDEGNLPGLQLTPVGPLWRVTSP
jgi:hypothetical protein